MEEITYKLEKFEGPLDLLLNLIHKNKVQIEDIPIALICDQYVEYIARAQSLDMELAVEFLNMASELMLIKSRMLLPREVPEEEDPRARLAEAIARLEAARKAAAKLGDRYKIYGGRMAKDTDEISWEVEANDKIKWYEWESDMDAIAKKYPNIEFCIEGKGEDNEDWWIALYKGRLKQITYAEPPIARWID